MKHADVQANCGNGVRTQTTGTRASLLIIPENDEKICHLHPKTSEWNTTETFSFVSALQPNAPGLVLSVTPIHSPWWKTVKPETT